MVNVKNNCIFICYNPPYFYLNIRELYNDSNSKIHLE